MRWSGPLESAALLTVLRFPARAAIGTRGVLPWAPLVGLVLGAVATAVGVLGGRLISPFPGAGATGAVMAGPPPGARPRGPRATPPRARGFCAPRGPRGGLHPRATGP